ncbi:spore coat protein U-like protein [Natronospira proteinivora]|uniref:Spore coat protein U-like protein n=1 Tax=Natronospira proteinivora TaxID=1807133 RepID=A0ABT1G7H0_9GAMM|nr:spore coat U domain-containing protein [Natronospira proteinivora]MCP1727235.1 spore coat protein U-like protein [Natronospira proteinivora]
MKYRLLAISAALATVSNVALADTDTLTVSAEVDSSCVVTANDLDFGTINVLSADPVEETTTIDVTCTSDTGYEIGLDPGNSGEVSARHMTDGSDNELNYNLYQDAGHGDVWGDTEGDDTVADTGTGSAESHTVYGQVAGGQDDLPAGSYDDTINVTIYY